MIDLIENRLLIWGESMAAEIEGGRRCSAGFDIEDRGGETYGNKILLDVEVEETDRAVKSLDETLRNCVVEIYVRVDSTIAQKIKVLCIGRATLFRYRDKAHLQINKFLYDSREKSKCF